MAWTSDQLTALEEAIAAGALRVKYADREVTYADTASMLKVRDIMRRALGVTSDSSGRKYASFSKGLE